tara:strand:+ start:48 stop:311 length:264 start_codon:yes stop_codon:yes gene_type:complete
MSIKGFLVKGEDGQDEGVSREQADKIICELRWLSWGLVKIPLIAGALVGAFFLVTFISMKLSVSNEQKQAEKEMQSFPTEEKEAQDQ